MADRTALTAGVAAASIAAVVAATPALITPPNHDVQVVAGSAAAHAQRTVTTNFQLTALTLPGLLSAFADGYLDSDYYADDIAAALAQAEIDNGADTLTADQIQGIRQSFAVSGVGGAIYYAVDNVLPAAFDYDDDLLAAGGGRDFTAVYYHLAQDLGLPTELVAFILDPINTILTLAEGVGVPAIVQDFINDPILTALDTLGGPIGPLLTASAQDPIGTTLTLGEGFGVPTLVRDFINNPIVTLLGNSGLPADVAAFLTDPIAGGFDLLENRIGLPPELGDFVAEPTITTARLLAQALGLLQGAGLTGLSTAALRSSTDEVTADVDKAPTLFKLDVPATPKLNPATSKLGLATPKQFAKEVETAVEGFAKVVTPLKDKAVGTDTATDDAPAAPSFKLPKFPKPEKTIANFSDKLGKRAQSIADSLRPGKGDNKSAESDAKPATAPEAKTSSPDRKPGGFGGFGKHAKRAKASAGADN